MPDVIERKPPQVKPDLAKQQPAAVKVEPEVMYPPTVPWMKEQEDFLTKYGWKKVDQDPYGRAIWSDPLGVADQSCTLSEPDQRGNQKWIPYKTRKIVLPTQDGKTEIIEQTVFDPIPWNYSTERALIVQSERNQAAASKAKV